MENVSMVYATARMDSPARTARFPLAPTPAITRGNARMESASVFLATEALTVMKNSASMPVMVEETASTENAGYI
jgi:hypothetical protein